jgi:hypothetical protein
LEAASRGINNVAAFLTVFPLRCPDGCDCSVFASIALPLALAISVILWGFRFPGEIKNESSQSHDQAKEQDHSGQLVTQHSHSRAPSIADLD